VRGKEMEFSIRGVLDTTLTTTVYVHMRQFTKCALNIVMLAQLITRVSIMSLGGISPRSKQKVG
jgi:hypothetical protein